MKQLTVGDLRKAIEGMPDEFGVMVSVECEYDGEPTTRSGPAYVAFAMYASLEIDGSANGNVRKV